MDQPPPQHLHLQGSPPLPEVTSLPHPQQSVLSYPILAPLKPSMTSLPPKAKKAHPLASAIKLIFDWRPSLPHQDHISFEASSARPIFKALPLLATVEIKSFLAPSSGKPWKAPKTPPVPIGTSYLKPKYQPMVKSEKESKLTSNWNTGSQFQVQGHTNSAQSSYTMAHIASPLSSTSLFM